MFPDISSDQDSVLLFSEPSTPAPSQATLSQPSDRPLADRPLADRPPTHPNGPVSLGDNSPSDRTLLCALDGQSVGDPSLATVEKEPVRSTCGIVVGNDGVLPLKPTKIKFKKSAAKEPPLPKRVVRSLVRSRRANTFKPLESLVCTVVNGKNNATESKNPRPLRPIVSNLFMRRFQCSFRP